MTIFHTEKYSLRNITSLLTLKKVFDLGLLQEGDYYIYHILEERFTVSLFTSYFSPSTTCQHNFRILEKLYNVSNCAKFFAGRLHKFRSGLRMRVSGVLITILYLYSTTSLFTLCKVLLE
jgi:hypothetical protein